MKSNRNSQDSYPYADLKCYSKEYLKIHRGRFWWTAPSFRSVVAKWLDGWRCQLVQKYI